MNSIELEAGKMELIRAIANIRSAATLSAVKGRLHDVLKKETKGKTNDVRLTERMVKKYAGSWKDERSSDEIVSDIYKSRLSRKEDKFSPFDV